MAKVKLEVIPEPQRGTAAVLQGTVGFQAPFIVGGGSLDHVCGKCGQVLLKAMESGMVKHLVFKCTACGSFNRVNSSETA